MEAGATDHTETTHTVTFTMEVAETGDGLLVFTGPSGNSPQLDKFDIRMIEKTPVKYTVTVSAGEGGTISDAGEVTLLEGDSKTYTITPSSGYVVADVLVNGESVGAVSEYTVSEIAGDVTIEASFEFSNYTQDNRFVFPTDAEWTTLEARAFYPPQCGSRRRAV